MGPRRATARGGARVGAGRPDSAASSRRLHAEARSSNNSHATSQSETSRSNAEPASRTRSQSGGAHTSTAPSPPTISPVSQA
eukprot:5368300-Pleurochrysis_carterae.AAC.1